MKLRFKGVVIAVSIIRFVLVLKAFRVFPTEVAERYTGARVGFLDVFDATQDNCISIQVGGLCAYALDATDQFHAVQETECGSAFPTFPRDALAGYQSRYRHKVT